MQRNAISVILAAMKAYLRNQASGDLHFFTVNLAERGGGSRLLIDKIDHLREAFRRAFITYPTSMYAVAILPDHLHCVWQLPPGDDRYPARWQLVKSHFSRALGAEARRAQGGRKSEGSVWQRGYLGHRIKDDEDYARCVDYVHYNPVRHGLAALAKDWPYSTFSRWVERGIYTETWAGDGLRGSERA